MDKQRNTLEVTVDKSHIVTIGERLYGESIELIRELINNAYDADAAEVKVTIKDSEIVVEDDGLGMDIEGLKQYFNIGSTLKRDNPKSPKFERDRIGEFGIGKFASLSACSCFELWTKKDDFQANVLFDKEEWSKSKDKWHIPLEIEEIDRRLKNGTRVTLKGLTKKFNIADVERRIIEAVPIKAPNFSVYLNGHKVSARIIPGHKIPFLEGTEYGIIHGEIIISSQMDQDISDAGIECKVKQVTITKDFFDMEKWIKNIARIRGEVNADFLPITSDRTGFIKDTPQYKIFIEVMNRIIERIKPILEELSDYKENKRAKRALTEVLDRVKNALMLNPDFCPEGLMPLGNDVSETGQPGYVQPTKDKAAEEDKKPKAETTQKKKRKRKPKVKRLNPTAVVKKLKLGQQGVSCCIDHLGADSLECYTEGTIVYINRDHPLYKKEVQKKDTFILHIARLLTQEICLMKDPRNPRQAFLRQSRLLRDALVEP
ncbi:MAG: ATP-binding protein [Candidatus Omnitrophica bacterium]|nr:ATP-binding protein [Candidatus Omnitrophota bacterium]MBU4590845.1 ATP-binding protein [Candidatus Omnitrophota bacterium]